MRARARAVMAPSFAVLAILIAIGGAAPAAAAGGDTWVDDDWTGLPVGTPVTTPAGTATIGTDAFATATAALATTPTTIHLAAGSYPEQLDFDGQHVAVVGEGAGSTFIDRGADPLAVINGTLPFVAVRGGSVVSISGVTVRGSGTITNPPGPPPPYLVGVLVVGGGTLDLADSVVTGIREHPTLSGAQGGTGIMVGTSAVETGTLHLLDTVVSEYQKTGIMVRANSRAALERAEVVGQGWVCQIAMNGIQIQGEATIVDSVIRDNRYEKVPAPPPPTPDPCGSDKTATPVGIMVFSPTGPVTVTGSTIAGNEIGVYVSQTASSPITIQDDDITGLLGDPLATEGSYGLYAASSGSGSGIVADSNRVQQADYGITTSGPQSVTSNLVQSNGVGISLLDPPALVAANALLENATGIEGAYSNPSSNWFGCNAGPGAPGCDPIAGGYGEPAWLVFTMALSGCTVAQGKSLEVTAAITQTSAGGTTSGHFVPELPITPISGSGVVPVAATSTLIGGTATLGFVGGTVGPAALSATAQHQVVSSPGAATGCATGVTVTFAELAPTGEDAAVPAFGAAAVAAIGFVLLLLTRSRRTRAARSRSDGTRPAGAIGRRA